MSGGEPGGASGGRGLTDAVAHPRAVVVELGHAAVAHRAVLGAQRTPHQAGRTEARRLEPAARRLRQLDDGLQQAPASGWPREGRGGGGGDTHPELVLARGRDDAGVGAPRAQEAVPQRARAQREQQRGARAHHARDEHRPRDVEPDL